MKRPLKKIGRIRLKEDIMHQSVCHKKGRVFNVDGKLDYFFIDSCWICSGKGTGFLLQADQYEEVN